MHIKRFFVAVLAAVLVLSFGPVRAGEDLIIPLKFIPTTNPGKVAPQLREGISNKPIALVIEDARQVKTKDLIGEGTKRRRHVPHPVRRLSPSHLSIPCRTGSPRASRPTRRRISSS
jgi:hypothetical protein